MSSSCAYDQPLNHAGKIAYVGTSAFSGSLSVLGSSLLIWIVLREGQTKLPQARNRLLFCRSTIDVCYSIALGLSVIVTPQETACSIGLGNLSTCSVQGFFVQLGFAIQAYTAMVSLYHLLTIRYGMSPARIARRYEPFMHAYALVFPVATASIGAAEGMYFNETTPCWIGDICRSLGNCPNGNVWGRGFWIVAISSFYSFVNLNVTVYCALALSCTHHEREAAIKQPAPQRETTNADAVRTRTRLLQMEIAAKDAVRQAYLHVLAILSVQVWALVAIITSFISDDADDVVRLPTWFLLAAATSQPLLGFWNFLIFLGPMVSAARREQGDGGLTVLRALNILVVGVQNYPRRRRELDAPIESISIRHNGEPIEPDTSMRII